VLEINQIHQGDCMVLMKEVEDNSVDLILCDLPYGSTGCDWDKTLPLNKLWEVYKRILKEEGVVVLTSSQPFTTDLINSNRDWFKYCWVWDKGISGNIFLADRQPLKIHEDIVVFSKSNKYFPIKISQKKRKINGYGSNLWRLDKYDGDYTDTLYPKSIIYFPNTNRKRIIHPTEKPIELFRYLVQTYTKEGDIVLDNTAGVGTTAVACKQSNRKFICIEINPEFVEVGKKRLLQKTIFDIAEKRDVLNSYMEVSADSSQP